MNYPAAESKPRRVARLGQLNKFNKRRRQYISVKTARFVRNEP